MTTVKVNGVERKYDEPGTLLQLIEELGVNSQAVVAEVDGRIVARGEFAQTPVLHGQSIEIIRIVGGG